MPTEAEMSGGPSRPAATTACGHAVAEVAGVAWTARTADHPICTRRAGPRGASRQMLGVCGWAAALSLLGLAAGVRSLVAISAGVAPDWYEPVMASVGLGGVALTMVAFLSIQRPRLPWIMLSLATVPLGVNVTLSVAAL